MDPPSKIRLVLFVMFLTFSEVVGAFDRDCNEDEMRIYIEEKLNRYIIIVYSILITYCFQPTEGMLNEFFF